MLLNLVLVWCLCPFQPSSLVQQLSYHASRPALRPSPLIWQGCDCSLRRRGPACGANSMSCSGDIGWGHAAPNYTGKLSASNGSAGVASLASNGQRSEDADGYTISSINQWCIAVIEVCQRQGNARGPRETVPQACREAGVSCLEEAPLWEQRDTWLQAFISNRCAQAAFLC